jgi:hypothetical protein
MAMPRWSGLLQPSRRKLNGAVVCGGIWIKERIVAKVTTVVSLTKAEVEVAVMELFRIKLKNGATPRVQLLDNGQACVCLELASGEVCNAIHDRALLSAPGVGPGRVMCLHEKAADGTETGTISGAEVHFQGRKPARE